MALICRFGTQETRAIFVIKREPIAKFIRKIGPFIEDAGKWLFVLF